MSVVCVMLGGTGTGKSTIVNRLLSDSGAMVTASSFRRTFTSGAVAIVNGPANPLPRSKSPLPDGWMGLPLRIVAGNDLPARGASDVLSVVEYPGESQQGSSSQWLGGVAIVDTPDIDGDQPDHHTTADRAFRWAEAIILVLTPEKYQLPEPRRFLNLARRYDLPVIIVINKLDDPAVASDVETQFKSAIESSPAKRLFKIARDESSLSIDPSDSIIEMRACIARLTEHLESGARSKTSLEGIARRLADVNQSVLDRVLDPLRALRTKISLTQGRLRDLVPDDPGVALNALTAEFNRQMRERSVLYLMSPQRTIARLRELPGRLARLPKSTLDLLRGSTDESGNRSARPSQDDRNDTSKLPDFPQLAADQFRVVQATIREAITEAMPKGAPAIAFEIDADRAASIVTDEMNQLRDWLESHRGRDPLDTRIVKKLLGAVPGADKLTRYSEWTPYLLAAGFLTTRLSPIPIDLLVIGGFSLAAWGGEKLNNAVVRRTSQANTQISVRYAALVAEQIEWAIARLDQAVPSDAILDRLAHALDESQLATEA
jgi:GTPase SAR1 family protein